MEVMAGGGLANGMIQDNSPKLTVESRPLSPRTAFALGFGFAIVIWAGGAYLRNGFATFTLIIILLTDLFVLVNRERRKGRGHVQLAAGLTSGFLTPYILYAVLVVHWFF